MENDLTYQEFEVLAFVERHNHVSKEQLEEQCEKIGVNIIVINSVLQNEWLEINEDKYKVTDLGLEMLKPYRVKRAIIMAAGFGSRMVPITLNTPKPLVRVNGKQIIETLLDAINLAEIEEVYLVRGYLWEQFDALKYKYPNIKFILNEHYSEANNISSALLASQYIQDAYVMEADLLIGNPEVVRKYEYKTNYLGRYCEHTDDWCFKTDSGIITELNVVGDNCYHMYGISYWTQQDGNKLKGCIEKVYNMSDGKQKYWDEVSLRICKDEFEVAIRPCFGDDVIEIDTLEELAQIDHLYKM